MTDGRDPGDRSAEPPSRGDGPHADVVAGVEAALDARVVRATPLSGGQIGRVVRVDLADGRRFVAKTGPTPLSVEGRMLRYLAEESPLPVPAVHRAGDDLLVLAYVPGDDPVTPAVERDLADRLAACHAVTTEAAGFPFDTLSGRLAQPNPWTDSWIEFFRTHRLGHAADAARENGTLPAALHDRVRALAADLDDLVVEPDAPALLHGDVWRANLRIDGDRVAAVLDPACYYGHPEVELAYALWTGTVGDAFLDRYRARRGLDDGFERRRAVYAVHPLVEHVWHFGAAYVDPLADQLDALGY